MTFYAMEWTYGRAVDSKSGDRLVSYHSFPSHSARNAWVAARKTGYIGNAGFREAVSAGDAELRRLLRREDAAYCVTDHNELED